MRKVFLGSLCALLAGTGLCVAQPGALPPTGQSGSGHSTGFLFRSKTASMECPSPSSVTNLPPADACNTPTPACPAPCDPAMLDCEEEHVGFNLSKRIWVGGEFLYWWIKDGPVPTALVTANSNPDAVIIGFGGLAILQEQGTRVLFGEGDVVYDAFVGGRFSAGLALNEKHTLALEGNFFALQEQSNNFATTSDAPGNAVLARPIFDANNNQEAVLLVGFPGAFTGGVIVESTSQIYGGELNLVKNIFCVPAVSLDVLGGFRYLNLREELQIQNIAVVGAAGLGFFNGVPVGEGTGLGITDLFETENNFYGGQLGARLEWRVLDGLYVYSKLQVAVGPNVQTVTVDGSSSLWQGPGQVAAVPGGLLALSSNIGERDNTEFCVIPEANVNVGYNVTQRIRIYGGYTFIYISEAARPGEQVDANVNINLIPTSPTFGLGGGGPVPRPLSRSNDMWVHGMNFGVAFRF